MSFCFRDKKVFSSEICLFCIYYHFFSLVHLFEIKQSKVKQRNDTCTFYRCFIVFSFLPTSFPFLIFFCRCFALLCFALLCFGRRKENPKGSKAKQRQEKMRKDGKSQESQRWKKLSFLFITFPTRFSSFFTLFFFSVLPPSYLKGKRDKKRRDKKRGNKKRWSKKKRDDRRNGTIKEREK